MPQAKVFAQIVTDVTRLKDFLRAGLAREQVVTDRDGQPIMIGTGNWRRPKTRLVTEDGRPGDRSTRHEDDARDDAGPPGGQAAGRS